jgi:WD40 repeat protein
MKAHLGLCTSLAFSPSDGMLASGSQDTSILLWEPRRGTAPRAHAFLEDEVTMLEFSRERKLLIGGDSGGTVRAFEVQ